MANELRKLPFSLPQLYEHSLMTWDCYYCLCFGLCVYVDWIERLPALHWAAWSHYVTFSVDVLLYTPICVKNTNDFFWCELFYTSIHWPPSDKKCGGRFCFFWALCLKDWKIGRSLHWSGHCYETFTRHYSKCLRAKMCFIVWWIRILKNMTWHPPSLMSYRPK